MPRTLEENLREWFKRNAAALPWRLSDLDEKRDPYVVWISETMLQQTQVATVRDYFIRWMKRFPTIEDLAQAKEEEVLKYWQGLGYYSRARNLLKTAQIIASSGNGFPKTRKELEALPGIGAYTAGAILSLAFHQHEAILDGNLIRIFSRLYKLSFLPTDKKQTDATRIKRTSEKHKNFAEIYWDYARAWADFSKGYMHNEALMELGRKICKAKSPLCKDCPLKAACRAFKEDCILDYPPRKKTIKKEWHGTALLIESADGKYLAVSGGQTFLEGQLTLPHYESARASTVAFPEYAEKYIDASDIESIKSCGSFRHNITVNNIECEVLHITLKTRSTKIAPEQNKAESGKAKSFWIPKAKAMEAFANSFSLKALKKLDKSRSDT